MKTEVSIDLLLLILKKNIVWILIIALVAGALTFGVVSFSKPTYSANASFYVINHNDADYTQSALVTAAQALAADYIEIIKSNKVLDPVSEKLKREHGYELSANQLNGMISCQVKEDTAVFTVSVNSGDKNMTEAIISVVEEVAGPMIDSAVKRKDCIELLSGGGEAKTVSSNRVVNTVLAAFVGAIGAFCIFLVIALFDNTIRTEEDIKSKFDIPIIGAIPVWDVSNK